MFDIINTFWILLIALVVDAVIGDPHGLYRIIPHPVMLVGKAIDAFDKAWNQPSRSDAERKRLGVWMLVILVVGSYALGWAVVLLTLAIPYGWLLDVLMVYLLIAQKSLYQHVNAIANGLKTDGLAGGRKAVSMIVSRDPSRLDEGGISRAGIESCAENYSDGIVSPLFWFVLLGLPGLFVFKTVSTLDSMVGYLNEKYTDFGWASAKFDDVLNYLPARLSGWFLVIAASVVPGADARRAKRIMLRDCRIHHSPNAGWPETAMAGAIGVRLLGPRQYDGYAVDDPWIGEGPYDINADHIKRALRVYVVACVLSAVTALSALALVVFI